MGIISNSMVSTCAYGRYQALSFSHTKSIFCVVNLLLLIKEYLTLNIVWSVLIRHWYDYVQFTIIIMLKTDSWV